MTGIELLYASRDPALAVGRLRLDAASTRIVRITAGMVEASVRDHTGRDAWSACVPRPPDIRADGPDPLAALGHAHRWLQTLSPERQTECLWSADGDPAPVLAAVRGLLAEHGGEAHSARILLPSAPGPIPPGTVTVHAHHRTAALDAPDLAAEIASLAAAGGLHGFRLAAVGADGISWTAGLAAAGLSSQMSAHERMADAAALAALRGRRRG